MDMYIKATNDKRINEYLLACDVFVNSNNQILLYHSQCIFWSERIQGPYYMLHRTNASAIKISHIAFPEGIRLHIKENPDGLELCPVISHGARNNMHNRKIYLEANGHVHDVYALDLDMSETLWQVFCSGRENLDMFVISNKCKDVSEIWAYRNRSNNDDLHVITQYLFPDWETWYDDDGNSSDHFVVHDFKSDQSRISLGPRTSEQACSGDEEYGNFEFMVRFVDGTSVHHHHPSSKFEEEHSHSRSPFSETEEKSCSKVIRVDVQHINPQIITTLGLDCFPQFDQTPLRNYDPSACPCYANYTKLKERNQRDNLLRCQKQAQMLREMADRLCHTPEKFKQLESIQFKFAFGQNVIEVHCGTSDTQTRHYRRIQGPEEKEGESNEITL